VTEPVCDHAPGELAAKVKLTHDYFRRGDLFEVVPGQVFSEPCCDTPSQFLAVSNRATQRPMAR